jgi:hypothetical protein
LVAAPDNPGLFKNVFMKWLYTILFFIDITVLIVVSYLFLRLAGSTKPGIAVLGVSLNFIVCVSLLILIVINYLNPPNMKSLD